MYNQQEIANQIKTLLKNKDKSVRSMLSDLGLGINTISEFSKGKQISYSSFVSIADYLEVSVDYLLGKTETPTSALDNQLSEIEYALFGEVRDLNDDEKQKIIDFAKFVKSQRGTEK